MRHFGSAALALALSMMFGANSALALDRPARPAADSHFVMRVADLDRPARVHRHHRQYYQYWRYRAAYTRWLHNEYVVAGYPVHQYRAPTYFWVYDRCACRRW
jgi:hypothetical protein